MPAKTKAKQTKIANKNGTAPLPKTIIPPVPKTIKPPAVAKTATGPKRAVPVTQVVIAASSPQKKAAIDTQMVKVIIKGGAAVDSLVTNKESYRVFQDANKTYSATLNQSNLDANNNKFYIVQVLQN